MKAALYLFACRSFPDYSTISYPLDYSNEIFNKIIQKSKIIKECECRLVIHRDRQAMYYSIIYRIPRFSASSGFSYSNTYIGLCLVTTEIYLTRNSYEIPLFASLKDILNLVIADEVSSVREPIKADFWFNTSVKNAINEKYGNKALAIFKSHFDRCQFGHYPLPVEKLGIAKESVSFYNNYTDDVPASAVQNGYTVINTDFKYIFGWRAEILKKNTQRINNLNSELWKSDISEADNEPDDITHNNYNNESSSKKMTESDIPEDSKIDKSVVFACLIIGFLGGTLMYLLKLLIFE